MIERLRVNQFNVTPSAIRRLMKVDEEFVRKHDLSSLKTIGSGIALNCYCMYSIIGNVVDEHQININLFTSSWRAT